MNKPMTVSDLARMGGKARAEKLSKEERSESARKAVTARWDQAKKNKLHPLGNLAKELKLQAKRTRNRKRPLGDLAGELEKRAKTAAEKQPKYSPVGDLLGQIKRSVKKTKRP